MCILAVVTDDEPKQNTETHRDDHPAAAKQSNTPAVRQDLSQLSVAPSFHSSDLEPPGGLFDDAIWKSVEVTELPDLSEDESETDESETDDSANSIGKSEDDCEANENENHDNNEQTVKSNDINAIAAVSSDGSDSCEDNSFVSDRQNDALTQQHADYMKVDVPETNEVTTHGLTLQASPQPDEYQLKSTTPGRRKRKKLISNSSVDDKDRVFDDDDFMMSVESQDTKKRKANQHTVVMPSIEQQSTHSGLAYDSTMVEVVDVADVGRKKQSSKKLKNQTGMLICMSSHTLNL